MGADPAISALQLPLNIEDEDENKMKLQSADPQW
jgi:hypothetical protein